PRIPFHDRLMADDALCVMPKILLHFLTELCPDDRVCFPQCKWTPYRMVRIRSNEMNKLPFAHFERALSNSRAKHPRNRMGRHLAHSSLFYKLQQSIRTLAQHSISFRMGDDRRQ